MCLLKFGVALCFDVKRKQTETIGATLLHLSNFSYLDLKKNKSKTKLKIARSPKKKTSFLMYFRNSHNDSRANS